MLSHSRKIAGMHHRTVVTLLALTLLPPSLRAETGEAGWLRYAPLPPLIAQQYKSLPQTIVAPGTSAVARGAAGELARGLHSMLGENFQMATATSGQDSFVLGTAAEIHRLLPHLEDSRPDRPGGLFRLRIRRSQPSLLGDLRGQ